jgi:transcriptional regulator with XRE-family HTH domain
VDIRTILAQNLKTARQTLQITRVKLAEQAGISAPYLADIERRRTWVSDKTLQSLAKALNLSPWELIYTPDPKKPKPPPKDRQNRIHLHRSLLKKRLCHRHSPRLSRNDWL